MSSIWVCGCGQWYRTKEEALEHCRGTMVSDECLTEVTDVEVVDEDEETFINLRAITSRSRL
jgi:hypothetical protein